MYNKCIEDDTQGRSQGSKGRGCEVTICRQPTGLC